MKNMIIHKAKTRGLADHGWLRSYHTFSFAQYHNPERMHFGVLRVLNDDQVAPGKGFGTHPHRDMEIISIPLEGDLEHKDNMGNSTVIRQGDVQVMSAGTGVEHSENNKNADRPVKFLQIWLFPKLKGVQPRYGQQTFDAADRHNKLQQIVSPNPDDDGVWIHQDAWFYMSNMDAGCSISHSLHGDKNGVYLFVLKGSIVVNDEGLETRDAIGLWDISQITIKATTEAEILLMEVPMQLA